MNHSKQMKSKGTATALAFFLGGLGVHHFYLRQNKMGCLYLILCCTLIPVLIGVIDSILLLIMEQSYFDSKYNGKNTVPISQGNKPSADMPILIYRDYTLKHSLLSDPESYKKMTYKEVVDFMNEFVNPASREKQIGMVTQSNNIAMNHKCSIHHEPSLFSYEFEGLTANIVIDKSCCMVSENELINKLSNQKPPTT